MSPFVFCTCYFLTLIALLSLFVLFLSVCRLGVFYSYLSVVAICLLPCTTPLTFRVPFLPFPSTSSLLALSITSSLPPLNLYPAQPSTLIYPYPYPPSPPVGVSQVIELEKLLAAGGTPDDIRARIEKASEAVPEAVVEVQEKEKEAAKVEVEKVEEVVTPPVETPIVEALPVSVPV